MANNDLKSSGNSGEQPSGENTPAPSSIEELETRPEIPVVEEGADTSPTEPAKLDGATPPPAQATGDARGLAVYEQATTPQPILEHKGGKGPASRLAPVIAVRDLQKTYMLGKKTRVPALRGVSLEVYPGEFVAIMGPSGSGKSTFMNLMGCLDRPTHGEYWLAGRLVSSMSSDELAGIRNQLIGFVFQGFNLLGRATAVKNAALPMIYSGVPKRERERRARKALQLVGLGGRLDHKPSEMSGGQQQRVAIARSLVNGPSLLLADEPTGNLDSRTSIEIMGILQALNEQGLTIVLVTHDQKVAKYAKRQISFLDGRIVRDEPVENPRSAQEEWEALNRKNELEDTAVEPAVKVKEERV